VKLRGKAQCYVFSGYREDLIRLTEYKRTKEGRGLWVFIYRLAILLLLVTTGLVPQIRMLFPTAPAKTGFLEQLCQMTTPSVYGEKLSFLDEILASIWPQT